MRSAPPLKIESSEFKIALRPLEPKDEHAFTLAFHESLPSLNRYMIWQESVQDPLKWIEAAHNEYFSQGIFEWGIFNAIDGEFLGCVGIAPYSLFRSDCYEVGYWTAIKHQNKGIATQAVKIAVAVAFECLEVRRLQVTSMKANITSRRIIEKCAFRYEGEFRLPPSKERLQKGALRSDWDLLYALLPGDCFHLAWYESVLRSTIVTTMNGSSTPLSSVRNRLIMECEDPWFTHLYQGTKQIEGRKGRQKYRQLKRGDWILFTCPGTNKEFLSQITDVEEFKTLDDYLNQVTVEKALPGVTSLEEAKKIYYQWSTPQEIEEYGFLGIGIECI